MVVFVPVPVKLSASGAFKTGGVKVICTLLPLAALFKVVIAPAVAYVTEVGVAVVFVLKGVACVTDITVFTILLLQKPITAVLSVVPFPFPIAIAP